MSHVRGTAGLLSIAAVLAAQTPPAEVTTREVTPTFQSSVSLVRIPVVVRDKQGHAAGGLHKEDFQLTDHGKPQYISQFALEGSAVPKPAAPAPAQLEVPGEPAATAPKLVVPTRFVAYVFDDYHLKTGDFMYARVAALKHIEHGIPPEERIALLTLSGRVQIEFTGDVEKFRATLMMVMPVPPSPRVPPASFFLGEQYARNPSILTSAGEILAGPHDALRVETMVAIDCLDLRGPLQDQAVQFARSALQDAASEGLARATGSIRILNSMVGLLSSMPGDRVMVLVSPGIYLSDELQDRFNDVIERATRAGVVVNALDGRGVHTEGASDDLAGCPSVRPETQMAVEQSHREESLTDEAFLIGLAESTGGTYAAQNDFQAEFDRLALPPEYIYYLGFYPQDLKPDGKFHEIKVKLATAKGLALTARKGYWAPSHDEDATATATREIGEAVFSRDEIHDLPMDLHTEFYRTGAWDAKATIVSHFDIGQLPLRKQNDRNRDDVTVVCALFDRNGNFVKGKQSVVELRLKDANVEGRRAHGVTLHHEFEVKSGGYLVRVVARDAEGKQMAAVNGVVEIP